MRILVTGATGNVGRHLVGQLHEAGHEVRALTRNPGAAEFPSGVEVVAGDLTDVVTLAEAFDGAEALHLITFGGDGYADLTNGGEIVALAERCGIRRVSVLGGWAPTSVEKALAAGTIPWTLLQPHEFMGNTFEWVEEIRTHGRVSLLAAYPSVVVHEADIAAVAVCALTEDGHGGQRYSLTGPEALTPQDRIRALSDATGRTIEFVRLTEDAERERLRGFGYGDDDVEFGVRLATDPPASAGVVRPTVEQVTGRPARTFEQWARENAEAFRPRP